MKSNCCAGRHVSTLNRLTIIIGVILAAVATAFSTSAAEPRTAETAGREQPRADSQPAAPKAGKKHVKTVAVFLFTGVELLDFAGPAEVFSIADRGRSFRVITVAESTQPLKTMGGVTITPDYTFETAPRADVLVVPGGNTKAVGQAGREWLRKASGEAEITMSVCFGAFLLADIGLLDGISATTHHWGIEGLKKAAPKCHVVTGRRYVDSGRIITTAGVTAGIDGALRVVERMLGKEDAKWAAEEWMEHHRDVPGGP